MHWNFTLISSKYTFLYCCRKVKNIFKLWLFLFHKHFSVNSSYVLYLFTDGYVEFVLEGLKLQAERERKEGMENRGRTWNSYACLREERRERRGLWTPVLWAVLSNSYRASSCTIYSGFFCVCLQIFYACTLATH